MYAASVTNALTRTNALTSAGIRGGRRNLLAFEAHLDGLRPRDGDTQSHGGTTVGPNAIEIGRRLRSAREAKNLSRDVVARRAALEEAYVTGLENGQELRVDFEPLDALARALGISMLALVADRPRTKTAVERDEERKRDQREFWAGLPQPLRTFLEDKANKQHQISEDVVHVLANIKFKTKQPATPDDWRVLYEALVRTISANVTT